MAIWTAGGAVGEGLLRDDVLIEVEQVLRVVRALHLAQPLVVGTIVIRHPGLIVGSGEVDASTCLGAGRLPRSSP